MNILFCGASLHCYPLQLKPLFITPPRWLSYLHPLNCLKSDFREITLTRCPVQPRFSVLLLHGFGVYICWEALGFSSVLVYCFIFIAPLYHLFVHQLYYLGCLLRFFLTWAVHGCFRTEHWLWSTNPPCLQGRFLKRWWAGKCVTVDRHRLNLLLDYTGASENYTGRSETPGHCLVVLYHVFTCLLLGRAFSIPPALPVFIFPLSMHLFGRHRLYLTYLRLPYFSKLAFFFSSSFRLVWLDYDDHDRDGDGSRFSATLYTISDDIYRACCVFY